MGKVNEDKVRGIQETWGLNNQELESLRNLIEGDFILWRGLKKIFEEMMKIKMKDLLESSDLNWVLRAQGYIQGLKSFQFNIEDLQDTEETDE